MNSNKDKGNGEESDLGDANAKSLFSFQFNNYIINIIITPFIFYPLANPSITFTNYFVNTIIIFDSSSIIDNFAIIDFIAYCLFIESFTSK